MNKYTFKFSKVYEAKFRSVLSRLDDDEFNLIEDIQLDEPDRPRESLLKAVVEMDEMAALTFRLGIVDIKISKEMTEKERKKRDDMINKHIVKVNVKVFDQPAAGAPPTV